MIRKANSFKCEIQNSQQNEKNIFIFITKILFLLAESNSVQMKAPSIVRGRSKNVRQTMAREWDESECESCQNGNNIASIVVSFIYLCIYYGLLGNAKDRERERETTCRRQAIAQNTWIRKWIIQRFGCEFFSSVLNLVRLAVGSGWGWNIGKNHGVVCTGFLADAIRQCEFRAPWNVSQGGFMDSINCFRFIL